MKILMILIYSGLAIDTKEYVDLASCFKETKEQIGKRMKVKMWDDMNGSNPIPRVIVAYCVQGDVE